MSHKRNLSQRSFKTVSLAIAVGTTALVLLGTLASTVAGDAGESRWYRAPLANGKTLGYTWGVAAKGRKNQPLKRICEVVGIVAPIDPDDGYVESDELSSCGAIPKPTDSVTIDMVLGDPGSDNTKTLRASVYRPAVREVSFFLEGGDKRTHRTRVPRPAVKGAPEFRFYVGLFDDQDCIQRTVTYNGRGAVIKNEKAEAACN